METKKDTGKKNVESNYSIKVTLRFTPEEYSALEQISDSLGCTMSQAIRYVLFSEKMNNSKRIEKKTIENSIINTRQNFKKIAGEYTRIATKLRDRMDISGTEGSDVRTLFRDLEDMTLALQKSINEVLCHYGQQETHAVSRTRLPGPEKDRTVVVSVAKKDIENFKTLYYYMEKIEIIGNLAENAAEYVKDGTKRMRFKVIVERRYEDAREKVAYTVFADKGPLFEFLKKGTGVYVSGIFSENRKSHEKVIFPHEVRILGQQ